MTDDTFHLTPHDIRAQEFQRTMRGFDPNQVESFKERVAEELDRLLRDRGRLEERLKGMLEQLRTYRDRERAMNEALVAAQQLRADMQNQATREAEVILSEARQEASRIVAGADAEERSARERAEASLQIIQAYAAAFRSVLNRHQAELSGLEAYLEAEGTPTTEVRRG
jgi:DivIVA domain-containing protein